jgi:hypothetical protein
MENDLSTSRQEDAPSRDMASCMRDIFRPNTTRHAKVVLRKGIARKNRIMDSLLRGTVTEQTSGRSRQPQQKCKEGIRKQDVRELLHNCGSRRNSTLLRYQRPPEHQTLDWTLWRCRPPPKRKRRKTARVGGTGNTEAPASPKTVNWRWMNVKSESDTTMDHGIIWDEQS